MTDHKTIHEAINAVMDEVGYVKKTKSAGLQYSFAGEAALIQALRPAMVEHGIYMTVSNIQRIDRERYQTAKGTEMVNTIIHGTVKFSHLSGDFIEVQSVGEGSDSGDKSANKAMTGLYKYALRQTFCIETGDDPDKYASEERAGNHNDNGGDPEIITEATWNAWTELIKRAEAVKVPHKTFDRTKVKASILKDTAKELREIVTNAEAQAKAGE